MKITSGKAYVGDGQMAPHEPAIVVDLDPGSYSAYRKTYTYGTDTRVARLRVVKPGSDFLLGDQIGESWADTATQGICDIEAYEAKIPDDQEAYFKDHEEMLCADDYAVISLDSSGDATLVLTSSGFGDGNFPVYELVENGNRVGIEIEMIEPGAEHPFPPAPNRNWWQRLLNRGKP